MAKYNFEYRKHPNHKKHTAKRAIAWGAAFVYMIVAVSMVSMNATDFQASILSNKSVPAFNGTVSPIQKAPNYVAFSSSDYGLSFSSLSQSKIMDIPDYNPNELKTLVGSLTWGNSAHDQIRNAKITYSVPYMGNYELDGREYAGSHLAVDLKIPNGTPIYAIANGEVTKASMQGSGFGNHIVIKHPNVPTFDNENKTETLHSSYSHMKSFNIKEGDIVKKGDLIGYSGNSGLSTTPHLHFQIDRDTAPWHPYWPFTSKEASDAGMNFTQAVNNGLNQADAIAKTVNPMLYVQKYRNGAVNSVSAPISTPNPTLTPTPTPTSTEEEDEDRVREAIEDLMNERIEANNEDPEPVVEQVVEEPAPEPTIGEVNFEFVSGDTFSTRQPMTIQVKAVDKNGDTITDFVPTGSVKIETVRGAADISPKNLTYADFINGVADVKITPRTDRPLQLRIKTDGIMKKSKTMQEGSENTLFADIGNFHPNFQAIKFLKDEGVIQGYPDGSFKPTNSVSRVEIIKFILEGIDADLRTARSLTFKDTNKSEWYGNYLYTAQMLGIVDGYPDGTFKPTASVNKVEFLKMLINAMNIDLDPNNNTTPFSDIDRNQWYAPYVRFAHDKNLLDTSGSKFNPSQAMQRDEVAEAIYRVKVLTETGSNKYTGDLGDEFSSSAG